MVFWCGQFFADYPLSRREGGREGGKGLETNPLRKARNDRIVKLLSFHYFIGNQSHINKTQLMRAINNRKKYILNIKKNSYLRFEPRDF